MDTKGMQLEPDRRATVAKLERILEQTPIEISGTEDLRLSSRVGLGDIIHIRPTQGSILQVTIYPDAYQDVQRSDGNCLIAIYKDKMFSIHYYP